jgi:hypothetical protein
MANRFFRRLADAVEGEGEVGLSRENFHNLRRSAVRNMVAGLEPRESGDENQRTQNARSVFDRYNIVDDRDVVRLAASLLRLTKSGT